MTPALLQLGAYGYPESLVRSRSWEWLDAAVETIDRRELAGAALSLTSMVAAAKAPWSPEANEAVGEMLEILTGSGNSSDEWLLNPNATTDLDALRAQGFVTRVKKEAPSDVPAAEPVP